MIAIISGIILLILGVLALSNFEFLGALFAYAFGIWLIIHGLRSLKKPKESKPAKQKSNYWTLTFNAKGVTYECEHSERFTDRQKVLSEAHQGDTVHLLQYEFKGKPAFALIHDGFNSDFGNVPADLVNQVLDMSRKYNITGKITKIGSFRRQIGDYLPDVPDYERSYQYTYWCEVKLIAKLEEKPEVGLP